MSDVQCVMWDVGCAVRDVCDVCVCVMWVRVMWVMCVCDLCDVCRKMCDIYICVCVSVCLMGDVLWVMGDV